MAERTRLEDAIQGCRSLEQSLKDAVELIELGEEEGDDEIVAEAEASLQNVKKEAERQELEALLSGEADANDTFLEVHAGAGGTEAQDWTEMLLRMYMRWAEKHGFKVEYLEESPGEEAGLKSSVIKISGHNAYGWLKTESGVHRLVRISPFDANARRHTSFSSVWVYPVIDDTIKIEINENRHVSRFGRRRTTRQQNRQRRPYYPHPDGNRRQLPNTTFSIPKQRYRLGNVARTPVRNGTAKTRRKTEISGRRQIRHRMGTPNPLLCPATLSDGQRFKDGSRNLGHERRP